MGCERNIKFKKTCSKGVNIHMARMFVLLKGLCKVGNKVAKREGDKVTGWRIAKKMGERWSREVEEKSVVPHVKWGM